MPTSALTESMAPTPSGWTSSLLGASNPSSTFSGGASHPTSVSGGTPNYEDAHSKAAAAAAHYAQTFGALTAHHPNQVVGCSLPTPSHIFNGTQHAHNNSLLREEEATLANLNGLQPYSYTYGYAKLARWMQTRWSRESCEAVDRALNIIRPRFLTISRGLTDSQLLNVEESFVRLLKHYQTHVLDLVPIPMFVTRRTGEVYAANDHMARLLQLPRSMFEGGQISHFQTTNEESTVRLWQVSCARLFTLSFSLSALAPPLTYHARSPSHPRPTSKNATADSTILRRKYARSNWTVR